MNNVNISIEKITLTKSSVDILWNDRQISNFHFLWLRDNCPSSFHPETRMRKFNLLDVSKDIYPIDCSVSSEKNLIINWSEKNHRSVYNIEWLRDNCYTIKNRKYFKSPYFLWDSSLEKKLNSIEIEFDEIMDSDKGLLKWLENLHFFGLSILKNCPKEKKSAFKILKRISHIRETFFGTPFEVINIPKPNNQAYTADALSIHTDLPYFEYPPGYQFLHCLINDAKGGQSTCVDGFKVANLLRKKDIKNFNLLKDTIVKFKDNDFTQNKIRIHHSPIINLTKDLDFNDIRFNMGAMGVIDIKPDLMDKFYKAYRKFSSLLNDKKYKINFKLESGDMFCFNNRRVLHGRTKFDPRSGHRHLQGYYIDRDEIISRLNFLKKINI